MANIINIAYFNGGELNISSTDQQAIEDDVNTLIAKYEPAYLKGVLGYPLYAAFLADNYPTPATTRFMQLLNGGVTFTDRNKNTKEWMGLNDVNNTDNSPIACYIWFQYQRKIATYSSIQGEVKAKAENSSNVSVAYKQTQFWNEMGRQNNMLWEFLMYAVNEDGSQMFPEFDYHQINAFNWTTTSIF